MWDENIEDWLLNNEARYLKNKVQEYEDIETLIYCIIEWRGDKWAESISLGNFTGSYKDSLDGIKVGTIDEEIKESYDEYYDGFPFIALDEFLSEFAKKSIDRYKGFWIRGVDILIILQTRVLTIETEKLYGNVYENPNTFILAFHDFYAIYGVLKRGLFRDELTHLNEIYKIADFLLYCCRHLGVFDAGVNIALSMLEIFEMFGVDNCSDLVTKVSLGKYDFIELKENSLDYK